MCGAAFPRNPAAAPVFHPCMPDQPRPNLFLTRWLCLTLITLLAGCSTTSSTGVNPATQITLRNLSYRDGGLTGELVNQSPKTARTITLTVSFLDAQGQTILTQDFKAVPGGDGRSLSPGSAKHFRYQVRFNAGSATPTVSATIKTVFE